MKFMVENSSSWWADFHQSVGNGNNILGILLIAQFVAVLVDYFVFGNANHMFAFLLATELHIFGFLILYDLECEDNEINDGRHNIDSSDKGHGEYTPPPIGDILVESGEGSTVSNITSYSEDPSHSSRDFGLSHQKIGKGTYNYDEKDDTSYSSPASISTTENSSARSEEEDHYDRNRSLDCFCGLSISYAGFFALLHTLSALLLLASLNQQMYDLNLSSGFVPEEWARTLFLLSYGIFLACTTLSYYKRCLEQNFDCSIMRNSCVKQSMSVVAALLALGVFGNACLIRNRTTEELSPFFYGSTTGDGNEESAQPYIGEAWVSGASIIDDSSVCENYYDSIPINVTVVYGGDWACPENPDQQCAATVTSQVECQFFDSLNVVNDDAAEAEDEYENAQNDVTVEDYIYFRYHDYDVDDDNFLYGFNEMPSFSHWNRPTDTIMGACDGSCVTRPARWITETYWSYARSNHAMILSLGIGICFLGWPLLEWWKEYRSRRYR